MNNMPPKVPLSPSRPIPTFQEQSELARYVDPDELKHGGRVSSAAFIPKPGEAYLSVNSIEIESVESIANYYRNLFGEGISKVAVACRKISDYNSAARNAGITIKFNELDGRWKYSTNGSYKDAYRHIPVHGSYSHCGVEYLGIAFPYHIIKKIARRLAGKRPHLFEG